jgi:hypothetical protein
MRLSHGSPSGFQVPDATSIAVSMQPAAARSSAASAARAAAKAVFFAILEHKFRGGAQLAPFAWRTCVGEYARRAWPSNAR